MLKIKRAYDTWDKEDGFRILIDGAWPKGLGKDEGRIDLWIRQLAPMPGLRKWFGEEVKKFGEFSRRYKAELVSRRLFLGRIKAIEREEGTVTLVYAAKDHEHNSAVVLKEYLEQN